MSDFPSMEEPISTEIQSQPNSREAEEAVLGSVLIYPESYYEIAQVLHADDFYVIRNQWLWESFTRLHDRRIPIDILTVSQDLEERNQLTEIGGQSYLLALVNQTPTALHAEAYAQIVEQNAVRRRMLASANELAKLAYDQDRSLDAVIASIGPDEVPAGLAFEVVTDEAIDAAVSRDDRWAHRTSITLSELADRRLIALPDGTGIRAQLDKACTAANVAIHVAFEAGSPMALAELAEHGLGVAILPQSVSRAREGLVPLTITPELRGRLVFAWRASGPISPAARALVGMTRTVLH